MILQASSKSCSDRNGVVMRGYGKRLRGFGRGFPFFSDLMFVICWYNMEVLEDFSPIIDHSNLVIKAHSTMGGAN